MVWKINSFVMLMALQMSRFLAGNLTFPKTIVPGLPPDYDILSLNNVAKNYFSEYIKIISHNLTRVVYNGQSSSKTKKVEWNFMKCSTSLTPNPFGYLCINHSDWFIKTTTSYPSKEEEEKFKLTFSVHGINNKGAKISDVYDIIISIKPRCHEQSIRYKHMAHSCTPTLKEVKNQYLHDENVVFLLSEDTRKTLKIINVKYNKVGKYNFTIQCGGKHTAVNVTGSNNNIEVNYICKRRIEKWIRLIYNGKEDISSISSKMVLTYYVLNEFCGNTNCLDQYSYWRKAIKDVPQSNIHCINDSLKLDKAYKECDERFDLSIVPSRRKTSIGEELTLECKSSDILLSYNKTYWKRIRGGGTRKTWSTPDRYYNISKLEYEHDAFYQCWLETIDGFYSTKSNLYRIRLENILTGELEFLLRGVPFNRKYEDPKSAKYITFTDHLENEIVNILDNRNSIHPNHPSYKITSLQKENDNILVKGEVSMLRSKDKLETWSYLKWRNHFVEFIKLHFKFSEIDDINILNEGACMAVSEKTNCGNRKYMWPASLVGKVEKLPCPCNDTRFAYKECTLKPGSGIAEYDKTNQTECDHQNTELEELSKSSVTFDNAQDISRKLTTTAAKGNLLTSVDITMVTETLEKFHNLLNSSKEIEDNVLNCIDDLMGLNEKILRESEEKDQTTSRLITLLGDFTDELTTVEPFTVSKNHFALNGMTKPVEEFTGYHVGVVYNSTAKRMDINHGETMNYKNDVDSSISIPASITKYLPSSERNMRIITISYNNNLFFVADDSTSDKNFSVNSQVLSSEIRGQHVYQLNEPITISFKAINKSIFSHDKLCVFWNTSTKAWSSDGCSVQQVDIISKTVTCSCNHMTNFAVLFNAIPPEDIHGDILTYITYVGLCISLVGAFLTLMTYSIFPMLRGSIPPKILMNLCAALIAMKMLFLIGVNATSSKAGCQATAILLQYFFLSVFTWSAVEGFHSARGLVFPMRVEINAFMQKALAFGWGAPSLLTAVGAGVWFHDYGGEKSCVVRGDPFYYTVLIPVIIVLAFNLTSMFAISHVLARRAKKYKSSSMTMNNRVRIIFGFIVLLGVTWTFGFLVISNDMVVFQYMFCIFCCFKGLYIFLLYGIRKDKHRRCWRKLLRGNSIREINKILIARSHRSFNTRSENGETIREKLTSTTSEKLTSTASLSSNDKVAVSTIKIQLKNLPNSACQLERGDTLPNSSQSMDHLNGITAKTDSMDHLLEKDLS